jgi:hypothetical protein
MRRRTLFLATLTVLALGYGLTHHSGIPAPGVPSASEPDGGEQEVPSDGVVRDMAAVSQSRQRGTLTERRPLNGQSQDIDWADPPIPVDIESDEPPIDIGERLGVDDEWGAELTFQQEDPIDIGAELDADDPLTWTLEAPSEPPVDIGVPLDADDLEASDPAVAAEDYIEIGPDLDADDASG